MIKQINKPASHRATENTQAESEAANKQSTIRYEGKNFSQRVLLAANNSKTRMMVLCPTLAAFSLAGCVGC